jgi:hypothetical protein
MVIIHTIVRADGTLRNCPSVTHSVRRRRVAHSLTTRQRTRCGLAVPTSTIAHDDHDFGMMPKPSLDGRDFAVGKECDDPPAL